MSEHAMIVEDVVKYYGKFKALDGVSLRAKTGQVLGLLGPNGAGKTTLVKIMTSLLRADQGRVTVAGVDALNNPRALREKIGLAGQYPAVDERLTGRENLIMVAMLYHMPLKAARARAKELLKRFTLEDAADRPIKTYSGGMRRRLDLAASIVAAPPVLFLDEPTTGLDPRTRLDLWEFIRELVRDGATLLLTTQYLEEADALADNIVVLDEGKVIAEGSAEELKARMGNDVLQVRIAQPDQTQQAHDVLKNTATETPQIDENTGWINLRVADGTQSLLEAVRALDDANIGIEDISLRRPTLDDVFLSLTGNKTGA
ncbi:MAG: ATP-binding cassette domain-containing protein [Anaerolineales bacterium]